MTSPAADARRLDWRKEPTIDAANRNHDNAKDWEKHR